MSDDVFNRVREERLTGVRPIVVRPSSDRLDQREALGQMHELVVSQKHSSNSLVLQLNRNELRYLRATLEAYLRVMGADQ